MRVVGVTAVLLLLLGGGLLGATGDGPAPSGVGYAPGVAPRAEGGTLPWPSEERLPELEAIVLVDGLDRPTAAVAAPDGRLFIAQKSGVILVLDDGEILEDPLLDLDEAVPDSRTEQGLLSIALHPEFESNGRFFVNLTDAAGDVRVLEYRMSATEEGVADPRSARLVMKVEQPGQFHNGGMLQFGPDGFLYASFGDGHFGPSQLNARELRNVLGSIVRLDVDSGDPYAVPRDNPFVGTGFAPEIWVYGMRNPWRFWIDPVDRVLVVADVGQFTWEEVTVLPLDTGGLDLGWPVMEGDHCHESATCDRAGLVIPHVEYAHSLGCAVIGGPVYRGSRIPALEGMVVYSDFCTGFVKAFGMRGGHTVRRDDLIEPARYGPVLSLATDADGEVLMLTQAGEVRRLQPAG